jgi:hypothetical protein
MMTSMDQTHHTALESDDDSPFGRVFAAYSKAFRDRDHDGLRDAFHPDAPVIVHDRRSSERMELAPRDFFTRLYREISDAEFQIETLKSRFTDGYLFADGTWIKSEERSILRAADLFTAAKDGRIGSLTVVWMHPEDT